MKIAHVVDSMEVGGAETLVEQMCRLQRDQGHDTIVYAVSALGALGERLRADGFHVHPNVGRHLSDSMRGFFNLFKRSLPDVVHLHNPTPTIYAALAARMAGVASIVSTRHSLVGKPRRWVVELKYAFASAFCDWIVGVCDATANNLKEIRGIPVRKVVRVYNGTALLNRAVKGRWPSKTGFTLVFVGRLEPVKNHRMLLHAFQQALLTMPQMRLWIVGDGTERQSLENLASDLGIASQVTFWGLQLDVAPFFSAADAFIMSSKSEGLPISLLQAFSLKLPVIVTDVGGMAEVVRMANAGVMVSATDPGEMTAAILRLARNDSERKKLSENAETAFRSQFSLQTMADTYMNLYQDTSRARRFAHLSARGTRTVRELPANQA